MQIINNKVIIDTPVTNPKKITGTRFASIFGLNPYSTPFQIWAEITHTWEAPFEDTKYTLAGKAIEPKQAEYIRNTYTPDIVYPKDMFGENYFNVTHGNFFTDEIFGGMWDYLEQKDGETKCVFEMKTTGKSKADTEWGHGKIPEYYALQASLYAWLLNVDKVVMVATFLDAKAGDYDRPEDFVVSDINTKLVEFKVSERYPDFENQYILPAIKWWDTYVLTGESPEFDPIKDADILRVLQKEISMETTMENDNKMNQINEKRAEVQETFDNLAPIISEIADMYTKELDAIMNKIRSAGSLTNDEIRDYMLQLSIEAYTFGMSKDSAALKQDIAKALLNSAQAEISSTTTGTQQAKANAAVLQTQDRQVVSMIYNTVSNLMKTTLDEAHRTVNTLQNILISRAAEAKLSNYGNDDEYSSRRILNE